MGGRRAGALLQQGGCGAGRGRREARRDPKVLEKAVSSGRLPLSCRASSMQDSSLQRKQSDSSREALGEEWSNLQSQAECKPLSPRGGRDCRSLFVLPAGLGSQSAQLCSSTGTVCSTCGLSSSRGRPLCTQVPAQPGYILHPSVRCEHRSGAKHSKPISAPWGTPGEPAELSQQCLLPTAALWCLNVCCHVGIPTVFVFLVRQFLLNHILHNA